MKGWTRVNKSTHKLISGIVLDINVAELFVIVFPLFSCICFWNKNIKVSKFEANTLWYSDKLWFINEKGREVDLKFILNLYRYPFIRGESFVVSGCNSPLDGAIGF